MNKERSAKDDYFKIDVEAHLVGDMTTIDYFPGVKAWWRGIAGILRPLTLGLKGPYAPSQGEMEKKNKPEDLISTMDTYGVDMACLLPESMMDTTGYSTKWVTNGEAAAVCEKYPDRFIFCPNLGPIIKRGVKNAIWELEYLVKEKNCKIVKFYPPEDTYINDPELWPYYKKISELGVVLSVHTGWCWVPPGKSKYCIPLLLDEVATEFPEMTIIAFHMGWPYYHDLNMIAATHPNIYISLSLLVFWACNAPRRFAELIGEAIRFAGPERIVWGTDYAGLGVAVKLGVEGLRNFQIPQDMQEGYGYSPLTEEDKRKIFGENLAKILKIEPKRKI